MTLKTLEIFKGLRRGERERNLCSFKREREIHWRERGSLNLFNLFVIYKNLMENVPIMQFDGVK